MKQKRLQLPILPDSTAKHYVHQSERKGQAESGKIQDAHEAIRPTDISLTPVKVKESLSRDQFPSVSADLEAVCSQPDVGGCV